MPVMLLLKGAAKADVIDKLTQTQPELFPDTRKYQKCEGIAAYINDNDNCFG